jgi:hypothetical protein
MNFKYWVEFDEEGEIKALYKFKEHCKGKCEEFIVKLIPIEREDGLERSVRELGEGISKFDDELKDLNRVAKKTSRVISEVSKMASKLKKI